MTKTSPYANNPLKILEPGSDLYKKISKFRKIDRKYDRIPLVSTATNAFYLFKKGLSTSKPASLKNYKSYVIQGKNSFRCITLLLPLVGNLIVSLYDFFNRKNDPLVLLDKIAKDPDILKKGPKNLINDPYFMIDAISIHREALSYIGSKLKNNKKFLLAVIEKYPEVFNLAKDKLKRDIPFIKIAIEKNPNVFNFLTPAIKSNLDVQNTYDATQRKTPEPSSPEPQQPAPKRAPKPVPQPIPKTTPKPTPQNNNTKPITTESEALQEIARDPGSFLRCSPKLQSNRDFHMKCLEANPNVGRHLPKAQYLLAGQASQRIIDNLIKDRSGHSFLQFPGVTKNFSAIALKNFLKSDWRKGGYNLINQAITSLLGSFTNSKALGKLKFHFILDKVGEKNQALKASYQGGLSCEYAAVLSTFLRKIAVDLSQESGPLEVSENDSLLIKNALTLSKSFSLCAKWDLEKLNAHCSQSYEFITEIIAMINDTSINFPLFIPCSTSTHAMLISIERKADNTLKISFYNTGNGLIQYHQKNLLRNGTLTYQTFLEIENPDITKLNDPGFLKGLLSPDNIDQAYADFLSLGKVSPASSESRLYEVHQESGSCSAQALMSAFRKKMIDLTDGNFAAKRAAYKLLKAHFITDLAHAFSDIEPQDIKQAMVPKIKKQEDLLKLAAIARRRGPDGTYDLTEFIRLAKMGFDKLTKKEQEEFFPEWSTAGPLRRFAILKFLNKKFDNLLIKNI